MSNYHRITVANKENIPDAKSNYIQDYSKQYLKINAGRIACGNVYFIDTKIDADSSLEFAKQCIQDQITQDLWLNEEWVPSGYKHCIVVAKLPGVTDDAGYSTKVALADFTGTNLGTQQVFSQEMYFFQNDLRADELENIAHRILGNPLIHHFTYRTLGAKSEQAFNWFIPSVELAVKPQIDYIALADNNEALLEISKNRLLSLNLAEMRSIYNHFNASKTKNTRETHGLHDAPTDCELEILGQTWSEHCKHKEFNAEILFLNKETGEQKIIHSLFKTYIKGATDTVNKQLKANGNNWLIKVFNDNAGVVKYNDDYLFTWKVETHNSPSALDPYGGAITGILGNNRDPLGTGVGGSHLLFNTNVLCFGLPNYSKELLERQLHPRQVMEGVQSGIEDGGNKSGIPTVNGAIIFDNRYSGKPLVYCGTGGIMPHKYQGKDSWLKPIDPNDRIIIIGGRVGKDGIHGATFSSMECDEHSPNSAVQIGSPITQKKLSDFMQLAVRKGWIKSSTDNGAGGLSSSIGELAIITDGAVVHLEKVLLKYEGLQPWEIFISESQERMTLVVEPQNIEMLFELANSMDVEISDIGYFTSSSVLDIRYEDKQVAYIDMDFLHNGVPLKKMTAEWTLPVLQPVKIEENIDFNEVILALLNDWNVCSRESIIRQYDHEVKGKTIIKPLMGGLHAKAPQDAAVIRVDFESYEGIAISNGIVPRYGDLNAYEMSAGAFDEAIRQIISVGGTLPSLTYADDIFWSANDNFCVPDSDFHPINNPDGKEKLGKLVQMCEALYDMSVHFDIPMTSGKDSMKNDFVSEGVKISIPPTILYSMTAKIKDIRKTVTSDIKQVGDLIYQLGHSYEELGGSIFLQLFNQLGKNVPIVRKGKAKTLYTLVSEANERSLIHSSHDLSDGGLCIALAESCFSTGLGVEINVDHAQFKALSLSAILFGESHSRFVVSIAKENKEKFEKHFGDQAILLGKVIDTPDFIVGQQHKTIIYQSVSDLLSAWERPLAN